MRLSGFARGLGSMRRLRTHHTGRKHVGLHDGLVGLLPPVINAMSSFGLEAAAQIAGAGRVAALGPRDVRKSVA